jgi:hypothetical protein
MFDFRSFCEDYDLETAPPGHRHNRENADWINVECFRCSGGNPGFHLGFSEQSGQFVCWRCGYVPFIQAIRGLAKVSDWTKAKQIAKEYGGYEKRLRKYAKEPKEKDIETKLPEGILDHFPEKHKKYLESRNFDPDYLIDMWNLKATGPLGKYKNRIIAPIYYRNTLMSYQGRDITGKDTGKYKACEMEGEKRHHKHCLYGIDMAVSRAAVVVEGITDVWRLGPGAVATFGIKFKEAQVLLLYKHFDRIFVLFDETDPEASHQGMKLTTQLSLLGKEAEKIELGLECDPGELSDEDSKYLMRELLIR